ncbi:MAG: GNAT family N-acetyltransferase [Firmicutes bacterium]|nr:GNAT family N-acetyltransferase [Bacillota bacterium]
MPKEIFIGDSDGYRRGGSVVIKNDNGETMSHGGFNILESVYCGKYVPTLTIGGIGTQPEYRRRGLVREVMSSIFDVAHENGVYVSMLHPFSFEYYRKFGYEKIADHRILEFPITKLDFTPRCSNLYRIDSQKRVEDAVKVYNAFAKDRNIMFRRYNDSYLKKVGDKSGSTHIWYDENGEPASYITLSVENYYCINRMASINLNVYEMCFTTKESLLALFGFMRMFEGENDTVKIHNCAMSPEIELMLRGYTHTSYKLIPDLMARVIDVKGMLEANEYPKEQGHFRIKINDFLDYTSGVWEVEYIDGEGEARKLPDEAPYEMELDMPAFTQLIYGYEACDARIASFMHNVKINGDCSDFFRAFPKRYNGLFEHF